jgi:hypothetical protein
MDPRIRIRTKISWILNTAAMWIHAQFCHLRIFCEDMDSNSPGDSGLKSFLASFLKLTENEVEHKKICCNNTVRVQSPEQGKKN